jgi:hypothetical protein
VRVELGDPRGEDRSCSSTDALGVDTATDLHRKKSDSKTKR